MNNVRSPNQPELNSNDRIFQLTINNEAERKLYDIPTKEIERFEGRDGEFPHVRNLFVEVEGMVE